MAIIQKQVLPSSKTKSAVKKIVRTPMFRMRVEEDKTKYNRKKKHKNLEE